jgi:hypothetical protein
MKSAFALIGLLLIVGCKTNPVIDNSKQFNLKGDTIGMSLDDFKSKHSDWGKDLCSDPDPDNPSDPYGESFICSSNIPNSKVSFAGYEASVYAEFNYGRLYDLSYVIDGNINDYHIIKNVFIVKYNNPANITTEDVSSSWNIGNTKLEISRACGAVVDTPCISQNTIYVMIDLTNINPPNEPDRSKDM